MTKEARAGLVDVASTSTVHRLFVTERGEAYDQDHSGRILMNGRAVSRAPLAAFATPRLLLEGQLRRYECAAFIFIRALPHGNEATIIVTAQVRLLGVTPVSVSVALARAGWLQIARELLLPVLPAGRGRA